MNININGLQYKKDAELLFDITGEKTKGVKVSATNISNAKKTSVLADGTKKTALEISK